MRNKDDALLIKISNFLQLKNGRSEKISSEFLNPSDLYELYLSKIIFIFHNARSKVVGLTFKVFGLTFILYGLAFKIKYMALLSKYLKYMVLSS